MISSVPAPGLAADGPPAERRVSPTAEAALWLLVAALSGTILTYPTNFGPTTTYMESIEVIRPFRPFVVLYLCWMLGILGLVAHRSIRPGRSAGNVTLVAVFAAVFWGFWIKNTPWGLGQDSVYNGGIVRYIGEHGLFAPGVSNLVYFDFPAIHAVGTAFAYASGLNTFQSAAILRFMFAIGTAVGVYSAMAIAIESSSLALLGALLFVQGGLNPAPAAVIFYPSSMAFVLFVMLWLFALVARLTGRRISETVGYLMMFGSLTVTHLVTSAAAAAILLAQRVSRAFRAVPGAVDAYGASRIFLTITMLVAWEAYWTSATFKGLLVKLTDLHLADLHLAPISAQHSIEGGVLQLPWWASATRSAWLGVAGGLGAIALLRVLHRSTLRTSVTWAYAAALAGVLATGAIATLVSPSSGEFARLIYLPPMFTIPLALGLGAQRRALMPLVSVVAVALLAFSALPTFLVSEHAVVTSSIHEDQLAIGAYTRFLYGDGSGLSAYGNFNAGRSGTFAYYNPQAFIRSHDRFERRTFWLAENALLEDFIAKSSNGCRSVYVFEERAKNVLYRMTFAIDPQDPEWTTTRGKLARSASLVYANGNGQVYVPSACLK